MWKRHGAILAIAIAGACAGLPSAVRADEVTVRIDNFTFVPAVATIHPGDTIVWRNVDDIPHSIVSSPPGAFRSKALDTEESFSFKFEKGGQFDYFCGLHPHMKGKIVVAP